MLILAIGNNPDSEFQQVRPTKAQRPNSQMALQRGKASEKGMTLIELLVVIVILGLTASAVMLTLPTPTSSVEKQARSFGAKLVLASERAVFAGQVIGVDVSETGYQFRQYKEGEWIAFSPRDQLAATDIENMDLNLASPLKDSNTETAGSGFRVTFRETGFEEQAKEKEPDPPLYLFSPTGDASPLDVTFRNRDTIWQVRLTRLGNVEVARLDR